MKCTLWCNALYILGASVLLSVPLSTTFKSACLHGALMSHRSVTFCGKEDLQHPLIISASKSLHQPVVPTWFPPYHKSLRATDIPGRGTLGQAVSARKNSLSSSPQRSSSVAQGWNQQVILHWGLSCIKEVKMASGSVTQDLSSWRQGVS